MNKLEQAARQALEAIEHHGGHLPWNAFVEVRKDLREALEQPAQQEQPEFITHNVEQPYDWSEWVCPDPKSYLMKCCDCGLVHEAEFKVVRYKSETECEDCEPVDDPNLQAVFRMRRSEQWSPVDMAHRAGGMPMDEQPAQEPDWGHPKIQALIGADARNRIVIDLIWRILEYPDREFTASDMEYWDSIHDAVENAISRPSSVPGWELTNDEIDEMWREATSKPALTSEFVRSFARAIEAALKEKNT